MSRMLVMRSKSREAWCRVRLWFVETAESSERADRLLLGGWMSTRLILLLGMIIGAHYCDPQFYHYAGEFAAGKLPYRDFTVESPPCCRSRHLPTAFIDSRAAKWRDALSCA